MKKALKIISITLLVLILILAVAPYLFRGKLEDLLKKTINNNLNAQVEWSSMDVSLFRSFPDATVIVNDFTVVPDGMFSKDTLLQGKSLQLEMGVKQLLKNASQDPIKIDALTINNAIVNIYVDQNNNSNYDITKSSETTTEKAPFVFDLQSYTLKNATINYTDLANNTALHLTNVDHSGSGDFSAISGELDTQTNALISLDYNNINYLQNHELRLDALFEMDLTDNKYTFKENRAYINELPLTFNGYVQLVEEGTAMDLTFETPDSDFKNFLAVIPSTYRSSLDNVQTNGDFRVSGSIRGTSTERTIPLLDINITSSNAAFKYSQLPKGVKNINLDLAVKNTTGIAEETFVEINDARFTIDKDVFTAKGTLRNLMGNMLVNMSLKGAINLANVEKAYPLQLETSLQGLLKADVVTSFDMNAIDNQLYQDIKSIGTASLSNFQYTTAALPNPINVSVADVAFTTTTINLTSFKATSGETDIAATGTIQNLIPFVIASESLKGRFSLNSQVFNLNDFASTTNTSSTTKNQKPSSAQQVKIPDFLDAQIDFAVAKVIYDDLELSNAKGTLRIVDEQATIKDLSSDIFGGNAGLTGTATSKGVTPTFNVVLDLNKIDLNQSFQGLDLLQGIAPIAKALQGSFNTKVNLKGQLDGSFSPVLESITGDAFAQLLTAKVNPEQMPLLERLNSKLEFIDLSAINLDNLKTTLTFTDGNVVVKPFDFNIKGIAVNVTGGHSFTNQMQYTLALDVPARYFGNEIGQLLAKLTAEEQEDLTVVLPVALTGDFAAPNINVNTKAAVASLTSKIVDIQKAKLKDKASDKINDVLGDIIGNKPTSTVDTTQTGTVPSSTKNEVIIKDVAKDIIGGLFGKNKRKKDSIN